MQEAMPQEADLVCDNCYMQDFPNFDYFDSVKTQKACYFHPSSALTQDLVG